MKLGTHVNQRMVPTRNESVAPIPVAMSSWRTVPRIVLYSGAAAVIGMILYVAYLKTVSGMLDMNSIAVGADFLAFYSAPWHVIQTGDIAGVWDWHALFASQQAIAPGIHDPIAWFYPPTFLLLLFPLGLLPYIPALVVWLGTTITAYMLVVRKAINLPGYSLVVAGFPAVGVCLIAGQNGFLTAALAGGAALLYGKGQTMGAGVLLGLLIIKPQLAIGFAIGLLAVRAWKLIAVALGTAAALMGVSLALFGTSTLGAWMRSMQDASSLMTADNLPLRRMPTLFAMLRLAGLSPSFAIAGHALLAAGAAAVVWLVWRRTAKWQLRCSAAMVGIFLILPYSFDYDLVWLAFPIIWLATDQFRGGPTLARFERAVLALAWLTPVAGQVFGVAHLTIVQPTLFVLIALLWATWRRATAPQSPEVDDGDWVTCPASDPGMSSI